MRHILFKFALFAAMLCSSVAAMAQGKVTVKGVVTSAEDSTPLIGVSIVSGPTSGVTTSIDGTYSITVVEGTTLLYQYIGYRTVEWVVPAGIKEGTSVRAGQLIGSVGESAMVEIAEEPHLHFEMTVADLSVDPLEYFDEKTLESLKLDGSHGE